MFGTVWCCLLGLQSTAYSKQLTFSQQMKSSLEWPAWSTSWIITWPPKHLGQTDTQLTASIYRTTWISWLIQLAPEIQKGLPNLDSNEARDDGVALASAGPCANHLHLTPNRQPRQHVIAQFSHAWCSFWRPTNSIKTLRQKRTDDVCCRCKV